jgi:hypothetical protein
LLNIGLPAPAAAPTALDLANVPPRSFVSGGTGIGPEEEDGGHIVPTIEGAGKLNDAWPGLSVPLEKALFIPVT